MAKKMKVENCDSCPLSEFRDRMVFTCTEKDKVIVLPFETPDWCPLEDWDDMHTNAPQ